MTAMITTVTLNAAIDKTYYVPSVEKGKVIRVGKAISTAGGKGINVARVLRILGHDPVSATGFAGGYNGRFIVDNIVEAGIVAKFVPISKESRVCLNLIDQADGSSTELLEPGPSIDAMQLEEMKGKLGELASRSKLVIFSGSLPAGLNSELYAELIEIARSAGAETFLDANGAALQAGIGARPAFIKPNEEEIRPWLPDGTNFEVSSAINALMKQGIPNVIVTLGAEGALAGVDGKLYRIRIPSVQAVNTVGCGDAFVAGYAYGFVRDWPVERCLRHAAAAGSANALTPVVGHLRLDDHRRLFNEVEVSEWRS